MANSEVSNITVPISNTQTTFDVKYADGWDDIRDIEAWIGYPDQNDIIGLQADFENSTFTRLAGAVGKTAGSDFNTYNMYGNRKLCNLADDGTVNAWYGDVGYTEDGSNGQVMVYQPKFYYRTVPLKMEKIAVEEIPATASTPTEYTDPEGYHLLKVNYYLSDTPKYGFKVHPAFLDPDGNEMDGIYISAYEGSVYDVSGSAYVLYDDLDITWDPVTGDPTVTPQTYIYDFDNDKFCSIAGVKPASGMSYASGTPQNVLTRPNVEKMCQNRGSKWHSENFQIHSMEQMLMVVEYATFNMQSAIGSGCTAYASSTGNEGVQTGSTASLGNGSGAASTTRQISSAGVITDNTTNGKVSIRYRGRENDWGNLWEFTNGINIWGNGYKRGGVAYYCTDYNYAESKKSGNYESTGITCEGFLGVTNAYGYINNFGWSEKFDWGFIATRAQRTGADSTKPVGDYQYSTRNLNGYRIVYRGGYWNSSSAAGPFYWSWYNSVGHRYRSLGGRLCCLDS